MGPFEPDYGILYGFQRFSLSQPVLEVVRILNRLFIRVLGPAGIAALHIRGERLRHLLDLFAHIHTFLSHSVFRVAHFNRHRTMPIELEFS